MGKMWVTPQMQAAIFRKTLCGGQDWPSCTQPYLALHAGHPGARGEDNEVGDRSPVVFAEPTEAGVTLAEDLIVGPVEKDLGEITHLSLWNAPKDGFCMFVLEVERPREVLADDAPILRKGNVSLGFGDGC